jgi:hypothetical protein
MQLPQPNAELLKSRHNLRMDRDLFAAAHANLRKADARRDAADKAAKAEADQWRARQTEVAADKILAAFKACASAWASSDTPPPKLTQQPDVECGVLHGCRVWFTPPGLMEPPIVRAAELQAVLRSRLPGVNVSCLEHYCETKFERLE